MERLILDTGALIALERAEPTADPVSDDSDDVAIAAITAAELLVGVELAGTAHHQSRLRFVEGVLQRVQILAFDLAVARHHAILLGHARRTGRPRGAHDLQIAATARASERIVITTDQSAFSDLPSVAFRVLGAA